MLYTHRTHSIINIVPQTAEFVYDLTTAEAVTAEFKHGLSASALDDAITSCSQVIATLCDRVFALQTVIEEFNIALLDHRDALNLSRYPVQSIHSVTSRGISVPTDQYEVDSNGGLLYRTMGTWHGKILVEYTGGYPDLPDSAPAQLSRATIELLKAQRFAANRNPAIRDITNADQRVIYFDPRSGIDALSPMVTGLIEPFKRYGA